MEVIAVVVDKSEQSKAWRTVDRRLMLDRSPYARVYDDDVQLPDGKIVKNFVRVELPEFVVIFALTTDQQVVMVRQFRQAVGNFTLELAAGHIEDGEQALEAAQRELREETGYGAGEWTSLGRYIMDANRHCGWGNLYMVQNASLVASTDSGDLGEQEVHVLPLNEVRQRWKNGEYINGPTSLCIGLALNRLTT